MHVSLLMRNRRPLPQAYSSQQPRVQSFFSQLEQPGVQPQQTHDDSWYFSLAGLRLQLLRWQIQSFVPPKKQLGFITWTAGHTKHIVICLSTRWHAKWTFKSHKRQPNERMRGQTWGRPDWSMCWLEPESSSHWLLCIQCWGAAGWRHRASGSCLLIGSQRGSHPLWAQAPAAMPTQDPNLQTPPQLKWEHRQWGKKHVISH